MSDNKLNLETLESRQLFAADVISAGVGDALALEAASTLESQDVALLVELNLGHNADRAAKAETIEPLADPKAVDQVFAAGDANRDGHFDQRDVIPLLEAGKYLSGEPATWSEGDFTGDGRFDQLDIVSALQTGDYAQEQYNWWDLNPTTLLIWRGGW